MATMETDRAASAAYRGAVSAAFRGGRRRWLTAALNLGAIVLSFGSANFLASTLFERQAPPTDVAVAGETKGDLGTAGGTPDAAAPVLADIARHARTLVAPSPGLVLFEPSDAFAAAFAPPAGSPPSSGFTSTSGGQASTPPVVEPDPASGGEPTLLAYLPGPVAGAIGMVAIEDFTAPSVPLVEAVATAAPLSILPQWGASEPDRPGAIVSLGTQPVATAIRTSSAATGSVVQSATTTLSTTTRNVTGAVRSLLN